MEIKKKTNVMMAIIKALIIAVLSCTWATAQNTISLEQASTMLRNNQKFDDNVTAVLDLNNTFDPFIGVWQSSYNGKQITLTIFKETRVFGRVTRENLYAYQKIIDNNGNILYDDTQTVRGSIFSDDLMSGTVTGYFIDDNECSLKMHAYFTLLRDMSSGTARLGVEFYDGHGTINGNACPNGPVPTIHPDGTMFEATRI
jgi:hypothetical protein